MDLNKAIKYLLIKDPFYGIFLLNLDRALDNTVKGISLRRVGINVSLRINESYWDNLPQGTHHLEFKHILLHIIFGHYNMSKDFPDKNRFNAAIDCVVNSHIIPYKDSTHIHPRRFGLEENKGVKYYYDNLPTDVVAEAHEFIDFDDTSDAEDELIQEQINYYLKSAAESVEASRGTIPGELKDILDKLFKKRPPIFNWKSAFRRMLSCVKDVNLKKTYKRESIRFQNGAGIKHDTKTQILVAVDTSGSVSNSDLVDFFNEIEYIRRSGADVTVIEFDTHITSTWKFMGTQNIQISGRGGTDFTEAWDYYIAHKKDYSCFVMFTDGYAPISHLRPVQNIIWVITSNGSKQDYPGRTLYIPKWIQ